jgi:ATP-dependent DNA helicase RecQ
MINEGICLVISPLVALMKDQVANLQKRNIKAIALSIKVRRND